jgi:hypothetical protein
LLRSTKGRPRLRHILDRRFRSHPRYEIVLLDRLGEAERALLDAVARDPGGYGVLRPRDGHSTLKAIGQDTALLLYTMVQPGPLPRYAVQALGDRGNETIAALVLDGVLEIESDTGFVSGLDAHSLVCEDGPLPPAGTLARLSLEAIRYAEALELDEQTELSARLYCFHRFPISPRWRRRFPSEQSVMEALELDPRGRVRSFLSTDWRLLDPSPSNPGWLQFTAREPRAPRVDGRSYKLYLSPVPERLSETLSIAVEIFSEERALSFKVGRELSGLLRPDKLVAYFDDVGELRAAGSHLRRRLAGVPAHGVPFTADLDGSGLLSWGIDPPRSERLVAWHGPSWRRWITDRLAVALVSARQSSGGVTPWRFALDRIALEGVDTTSWAPTGVAGMSPDVD